MFEFAGACETSKVPPPGLLEETNVVNAPNEEISLKKPEYYFVKGLDTQGYDCNALARPNQAELARVTNEGMLYIKRDGMLNIHDLNLMLLQWGIEL